MLSCEARVSGEFQTPSRDTTQHSQCICCKSNENESGILKMIASQGRAGHRPGQNRRSGLIIFLSRTKTFLIPSGPLCVHEIKIGLHTAPT